jgi:N12 class adenine-specific DNA methylase
MLPTLLSPQGSDAALDLYIKARWLDDKKPGRSLVMASGTPVTNTMAELYSVQRFMGRQALQERGIEDFDSWAAMFGRERTTLEANASGRYEPVTRFNKF